jgi:hypothetical protein
MNLAVPPPPGSEIFTPPKPTSFAALLALMRVLLRGDGDLLSLLPTSAYRVEVGHLGWSRRQTVITACMTRKLLTWTTLGAYADLSCFVAAKIH